MSVITQHEYENALKDTFEFNSFKSDDQKKAVECIMSGEKNVIISIATQGGKSLCYQLPSSFQRDGIILVISPNISLITNQLVHLNELRIPATSITSVTPLSNRKDLIKNLYDYENVSYRFLYVTPEMLIKGSFAVRDVIEYLMDHKQISHVAVDESHLIVEQENAYRESFRQLGEVRNRYLNIPWIALTTASLPVINKISRALSMNDAKIIKGTSTRMNIFYDVYHSKNERFPKFSNVVRDLLVLEDEEKDENVTKSVYASGIIYCSTNNLADLIAGQLCQDAITAESYYGSKRDGNDIQKRWRDGNFPVLVATEESFGQGINRSPLKFVVHMTYPRNLRAFYQVNDIRYINF